MISLIFFLPFLCTYEFHTYDMSIVSNKTTVFYSFMIVVYRDVILIWFEL